MPTEKLWPIERQIERLRQIESKIRKSSAIAQWSDVTSLTSQLERGRRSVLNHSLQANIIT